MSRFLKSFPLLVAAASLLLLAAFCPRARAQDETPDEKVKLAVLEEAFVRSYKSLIVDDRVEYELPHGDSTYRINLCVHSVEKDVMTVKVTTTTITIDETGAPQEFSKIDYNEVEFSTLTESLPNEDGIRGITRAKLKIGEETFDSYLVDLLTENGKVRYWYSEAVPFGLLRVEENGVIVMDLTGYHFEPRKDDAPESPDTPGN